MLVSVSVIYTVADLICSPGYQSAVLDKPIS